MYYEEGGKEGEAARILPESRGPGREDCIGERDTHTHAEIIGHVN